MEARAEAVVGRNHSIEPSPVAAKRMTVWSIVTAECMGRL